MCLARHPEHGGAYADTDAIVRRLPSHLCLARIPVPLCASHDCRARKVSCALGARGKQHATLTCMLSLINVSPAPQMRVPRNHVFEL